MDSSFLLTRCMDLTVWYNLLRSFIIHTIPFTAMFAMPSLGKRPMKVPDLKPLSLLFPFARAREKISIKKNSIENRFVYSTIKYTVCWSICVDFSARKMYRLGQWRGYVCSVLMISLHPTRLTEPQQRFMSMKAMLPYILGQRGQVRGQKVTKADEKRALYASASSRQYPRGVCIVLSMLIRPGGMWKNNCLSRLSTEP